MRTGITGGIGSGKSYVCRLLERQGVEVYDCDSAAKRLMRNDEQLRQRLKELIGPDTYITDDQGVEMLNKAAVAQFLLASDDNAKAVDGIVHPAVFDDFLNSGMQWVESAILFESGLYRLVDRVVVVTAPEETRIGRVMRRDNISREKAIEWMQRQWPQDELLKRADFEIVNDGITPLLPQVQRLLSTIPTLGSVGS